jgi:3-oxoacyl-[acyl-carrier-protein] synthase-3
MSFLTVKNVKITGLSACVPSNTEENLTLPIFKNRAEAEKVILSTGIERKRIVGQGVTASDLSVKAAEKLIDELNWERSSIDCLIYVCISRDFVAPMTSCILQDRLGLSNDCCVMDIPFGCSGWVHGMSVLSSMLSHGGLRRGLLICAETNSLNRSAKDKTVKPLFGDAATVMALEYASEGNNELQFSFGVDGKGYKAVWAQYGGTRFPVTHEALEEKEIEPGIIRKGTDMAVNGMDVFSFAIKQPVRSLQNLIDHFRIDIDNVDYLFLHQANKYINERIRKRLNMPEEKAPFCLQDFGNTNSASIPLTMITQCKEQLSNTITECLACGFGIGLAWASMHFYAGKIKCLDLIEYKKY